MSEYEHLHEHEAACGCEHEHHHHEQEEHGEHEHHHHHHEHGECDDPNCACHEHEHEHHHHEHGECDDPDCSCHEHHHEEEKLPGVVYTQVKLHDDAKVVSGSLLLTGDYSAIREGLAEGLKEFADAVTAKGGIIGHIKASAEVSETEMFSVTEENVMIKTAPEKRVAIILAAIVFFISEQEAEELGRRALQKAIPQAE